MGKFILQNPGLNGYWTDYVMEHRYQGRVTGIDTEGFSLTKLEKFLLDKNPMTLATQQRYVNFGKVIQNYSHFKLYWKTFSAPNASYSKKYLSQFFIKMTICARGYNFCFLTLWCSERFVEVGFCWSRKFSFSGNLY